MLKKIKALKRIKGIKKLIELKNLIISRKECIQLEQRKIRIKEQLSYFDLKNNNLLNV
jgi:hypothetical protein